MTCSSFDFATKISYPYYLKEKKFDFNSMFDFIMIFDAKDVLILSRENKKRYKIVL